MRIIINVTKNIIPQIILIGIFVIILSGVILYARGYRFNFQSGAVTSTGILSINSQPKAAKLYINGELRGATDVNLTLPYGNYKVEVKKEGYTDWSKEVSLKGEVVISLDAHLYSKNPSLSPLTTLGVTRAVRMGNTDKLVLFSNSGNIEKDGIYIFEADKNPISIFPPLTLLLLKSALPENITFENAAIDFSPNYKQGLMTFTGEDESQASYLISLTEENPQAFDITSSRDNILAAWDTEKNTEVLRIIQTLPKTLMSTAIRSFEVISLSPDEKRVMYRAKTDASLPLVIIPPLIGANQTPENRDIKTGGIYIYDKKEDKNYLIPVNIPITASDEAGTQAVPTPTIDILISQAVTPPTVWNRNHVKQIEDTVLWYPTSDYVAIKENNKKIVLVQYDGTNKQTVYSGPFSDGFYTISPDWNLLVLINLNPQLNNTGDLYLIGIR